MRAECSRWRIPGVDLITAARLDLSPQGVDDASADQAAHVERARIAPLTRRDGNGTLGAVPVPPTLSLLMGALRRSAQVR
jgi:hypothetical protein